MARRRRRAPRARRCAPAWCRSSRRRCPRRSARRTRRGSPRAPRGLREDRLAVGPLDRQACVGDAVDGHRRVLAEEADGVAHVARAGRAVQADDVDAERLERRERSVDVGAEEHRPARGQQRDGDLDRHGSPGRRHRAACAEDRGLGLEDVLDRLDDEQVHAAGQQRARLLGEDVGQRCGRDRAERGVVGGGEQPGRAHAARDEAVLAGGVAGEACCGDVDLVRAVVQSPLGELEAAGLERVGLEDLRAGGDHRRVDVADHVRAPQVQHLVGASGQGVVVLEGEIERLERGAHAAVEDHDAVAGGLEEVASHGGGR